jgi:hypothetical protein
MTVLEALWSLVPKWLVTALLVGALGHGCVVGVQRDAARSGKTKAEATLAQERTDHANENAQREKTAREAEHEFRMFEQRRVDMAQEIANALAKAQAARAAAHSRELADHQRLLRDIEAFLATGGTAVPEECAADLAAAKHRAAILGKLLGEADGLAGEFADAAERHADEVRALKRQLEADREGEQK